MKDKIDPKIMIIVVLVIVLLYCGFRSLSSMAAASGYLTQPSSDQNPGTVERLLHDLDRTMVVEADTSLPCPVPRDPFTAVKISRKEKTAAIPSAPKTKATVTKNRMRLTGLILDQNPVAIIEVDGTSLEVKTGGLLEGHKVISIDERGVQLLKDGKVIILN